MFRDRAFQASVSWVWKALRLHWRYSATCFHSGRRAPEALGAGSDGEERVELDGAFEGDGLVEGDLRSRIVLDIAREGVEVAGGGLARSLGKLQLEVGEGLGSEGRAQRRLTGITGQ